jgi:hypothetical protein
MWQPLSCIKHGSNTLEAQGAQANGRLEIIEGMG